MKDNKDLLKQVQEALGKDAKLKNCLDNVYILVNEGNVIMAGSVNDERLKKQACHIVSNVPGVNLLIEDLTIEPPARNRIGVQIDWAKGSMALT